MLKIDSPQLSRKIDAAKSKQSIHLYLYKISNIRIAQHLVKFIPAFFFLVPISKVVMNWYYGYKQNWQRDQILAETVFNCNASGKSIPPSHPVLFHCKSWEKKVKSHIITIEDEENFFFYQSSSSGLTFLEEKIDIAKQFL